MKLHCAILDDYQNIALSMANWNEISNQVNIQVFNNHFNNEDDLVAAIKNCDIIVIMRERTPFSAALFARLPNLKLLVTSGMRNAAVDLVAAAAHDVTVCGTTSASEPPVELSWALILGLARHIVPEALALKSNGAWQSSIGQDLYGKQLGLIGLGKTGSRMATIAQAFGMKVTAWSQNLTEEKAKAANATLASSKEALLQISDFVSIHMVLSDRTKNLIGAQELSLMKPSAYLINTSRAQIVNQSALIEALQQRRIAGAGLDVFDIEPLPANHPFRKIDNVLATPHLGYVTFDNYKTYFEESLQDIQAFLHGEPIRKLTD